MKISIVTIVLLIVGLGSFAQPFSIDSSFVSHFDFRSQNSPKVTRIYENNSGQIVMNGRFRFFNGPIQHAGIVSFNRNGSLNTTFTPNFGIGSTTRFFPINDSVYYLGTGSVGTLIDRFGQFANPNWTSNVPISVPCTFGWTPFFLDDGSAIIPASINPNSGLPCDVYLGSDTFPGNFLLKLQPNGLWDSTFNVSLSKNPTHIIEYDSNRMFLLGQPHLFTSYEGRLVKGLCRIFKDGRLDTTFYSPIKDTNGINSFTIKKIESDGSLFLVGAFYLEGYSQRFSLVKIHSNGSIDHSFMNLNGPTDTLYNLNAVNTIVETRDGGYLVGGAFNEYQGYPRRNLAKIDSVGKVDSLYFNDLGPDSSAANGTLISAVSTIVKSKFGGYYIGGDFLRHNGLPSQPIYRIYDLQNGVGINEPFLSSRSHKIYPNPASSQVQLNFQVNPNENVGFLLYSLEGKIMQEEQLRVGNVHAIQLKQLHKGIYIYQLKNDFGEFLNGKLVIN
jgi:hypothetical protein